MGLNLKWYHKAVAEILSGGDDPNKVSEPGLFMYHIVEFDGMVEEFSREGNILRIHQVRGDSEAFPVVAFSWCLAFSDRFTDTAQNYHKFYEYCQKNGYKFKYSNDLAFLERVTLFMQIHEQVLEYRQQAA